METQNVNVNEIHCKVQYGNEIRRFLLQGSYQVMLAQIREYFGFKVDEEINVKYTDDEGDLVTISSDEELVFAADLFASGVLRLNVTLSDSEPGKSACGKWARKGCGRWGQAEGSCGKWGQWGQSEGSCGKWGQSEACGKWGQRADGCGRWARNGNECDKWAKMRAERAECWKAKKAQKSANKCHAKGEKKMEKWEAKSAKKAQKWEDKAAKKVNKAEKWEAKRARWEEKKEMILADPELRKSKIEHIDSKLAKLQQRKQCMQTRVDAKENPWFAQRLEFLNHKMARLESFRASLANPQNSTPTPVVVQEYTFPPNQPFREVRY